MSRWAVFDVDGTLLPGTSMEKMFIQYLRKEGKLPLKNVLCYFFNIVRLWIGHGWGDALKNNKYYLTGFDANETQKSSREFLQEQIIPRLSAEGLRLLEKLRSDGYKILVMSGSPEFLTLPLSKKLNADEVVTTKLELKDGRFTGRVEGLHPYGERKKIILEDLGSSLPLNFKNSIVFANHHSDVDHMLLFGTPVAVNPTPGLRKIAQERGWKIEQWK
jgi:putative phosphoserine phosphatase/1-acylglycerol-3-phosphate O-acyltransferase